MSAKTEMKNCLRPLRRQRQFGQGPPPPCPSGQKSIPITAKGPGAYARQPAANARTDRTTAKMIPLSVSILVIPY